MPHKSYNHKLSYRIAQETQLLAEEKWLVEALTMIKKQRNCLQIERLHLESLKAKLRSNSADTAPIARKDSPQPTQSINMTQNRPLSFRNSIEFEDPIVIVDTACNNEELDLAVSKSIFGQDNQDYSLEEYDDDDEEDYDNIVVVDMNMLMNGKIGDPECNDKEKA